MSDQKQNSVIYFSSIYMYVYTVNYRETSEQETPDEEIR